MAELPGPMELLELQDGQSSRFRVLRYESSTTRITPGHLPAGKDVPHLRVHVPAEDKPAFPHYWDMTAKTLVAQLEPHLRRPDLPRLRFQISAQGFGPKKRFSVEVTPT